MNIEDLLSIFALCFMHFMTTRPLQDIYKPVL
jgi:hypothetical protein